MLPTRGDVIEWGDVPGTWVSHKGRPGLFPAAVTAVTAVTAGSGMCNFNTQCNGPARQALPGSGFLRRLLSAGKATLFFCEIGKRQTNENS